MPRAAPAGAYPAARLIFSSPAASVGQNRKWQIIKTRLGPRYGSGRIGAGGNLLPRIRTTRILDGLVSVMWRMKRGGWNARIQKICRWREVPYVHRCEYSGEPRVTNSKYCPDVVENFGGAWDDFC